MMHFDCSKEFTILYKGNQNIHNYILVILKMNAKERKDLTWLGCTLHERISSEVACTSAHWGMTNSPALCVLSTGARTRIYAFLIDASLLRWTFCITKTLGFAVWWDSYEFGQTRTRGCIVDHLALSVWTAR